MIRTPPENSDPNDTPKVALVDFQKQPLPGDDVVGDMFSNPDENVMGFKRDGMTSSVADTGIGMN